MFITTIIYLYKLKIHNNCCCSQIVVELSVSMGMSTTVLLFSSEPVVSGGVVDVVIDVDDKELLSVNDISWLILTVFDTASVLVLVVVVVDVVSLVELSLFGLGVWMIKTCENARKFTPTAVTNRINNQPPGYP